MEKRLEQQCKRERERNFVEKYGRKSKEYEELLKNFLLKTSNTLDVAEEKVMIEMEPVARGLPNKDRGGGGRGLKSGNGSCGDKKLFCFEV